MEASSDRERIDDWASGGAYGEMSIGPVELDTKRRNILTITWTGTSIGTVMMHVHYPYSASAIPGGVWIDGGARGHGQSVLHGSLSTEAQGRLEKVVARNFKGKRVYVPPPVELPSLKSEQKAKEAAAEAKSDPLAGRLTWLKKN